MQLNLFRITALLGILAVGIGAFGAHGLEGKLPISKMETYETAVQYHFYHTIALLAVIIMSDQYNSRWLQRVAWAFIIGITFFSGSLYLLACSDLLGIPDGMRKVIGPITPIGGIFFMLGWGGLFFVKKES